MILSVLVGEMIVADSSNSTFYHQLEFQFFKPFSLSYIFDNVDFNRHCNMVTSQLTQYDNIIPKKS